MASLSSSGAIRVNHPLVYKGIRIHQSFFGPAAQLTIVDADRNMSINGNIALTGYRTNDSLQRPEGRIKLHGSNYTVIVLASASNGKDNLIGEDELGPGTL